MSGVELKDIKYSDDYSGKGYDNPTYPDKESSNGSLPPYSEKDGIPKSASSVDIDPPSSYANSFSPNEPYDPDAVDSLDSDDEFEDLELPDSPVLQGIKSAQDNFWKVIDNNSKCLGIFFKILCLVLYFAYFIYALVYHFGDEGSIRLLWVTLLVVFCFIIYVIKRFAGEQISECIKPCWECLEPHGMKINYAILGLIYVFIVIFVIVDVVYVTKNYYNLVSLSGIVVYILLFFIFSVSPAHVNWRAVLWGLALQFILAIIILRTWWGYNAFQWLGARVDEFLSHTDAGSIFLFGTAYTMHFFAFKVLPVVIFFNAAISVLFYLGWMQVIIKKVAWIMQICMGTTAGESLNAAGNIFIGQSEAPLMIRPLLGDMTRSEIHAVMTGGFATIAGSVLAAYILMGVPANHLISASVMSAPAALAMAKLFYPETKKSRTTAEDVDKIEKPAERNIVEALSAGASASVSLVANIAVNLIAFLAMLSFVNATLTWFGRRVGDYGIYPPEHEDVTLEWLCSYILWPFALIMGTDIADCRQVAKLIGVKTILNEFVAYDLLGSLVTNSEHYQHAQTHNYTTVFQGESLLIRNGIDFINVTKMPEGKAIIMDGSDVLLKDGVMTQRSIVIATYALCGFANFGSMGVQLGALGSMAPHRKKDLSKTVVRAMIAGNVACFLTAGIAGLFYGGEY